MIWIVPIEPIDQRYTKQWYENIPEDLKNKGMNVRIVDGVESTNNTSSGAFLNFAFTNAYKASQVQAIALHFQNGDVKPGDKFLVTDAWNFVITAIRYMSDLLDVPVEIHGIWHAGAYDPSDILGMKMTGDWANHMERGWYEACDYNYFATEFHLQMFVNNLSVSPARAIRSGQPHTRIISQLSHFINDNKEDVVIWPHRLNDDKQPKIAMNLSMNLDMKITQKLKLPKEYYYKMLGSAKVLFSCALHENLGISMMEGVLAGAIPVVPDRCSYKEMYLPCFKYPSEWTSSYENFLTYRGELLDFIQDKIVSYKNYENELEAQRGILSTKYLNADIMYSRLMR